MHKHYKRCDGITVEYYDSGCIILDANEEYYHLLNSTATFIFDRISDSTINEIATMLFSNYSKDIDYSHVYQSVCLCVEKLISIGIVEECFEE